MEAPRKRVPKASRERRVKEPRLCYRCHRERCTRKGVGWRAILREHDRSRRSEKVTSDSGVTDQMLSGHNDTTRALASAGAATSTIRNVAQHGAM